MDDPRTTNLLRVLIYTLLATPTENSSQLAVCWPSVEFDLQHGIQIITWLSTAFVEPGVP